MHRVTPMRIPVQDTKVQMHSSEMFGCSKSSSKSIDAQTIKGVFPGRVLILWEMLTMKQSFSSSNAVSHLDTMSKA
jgi:hypothetical protein